MANTVTRKIPQGFSYVTAFLQQKVHLKGSKIRLLLSSIIDYEKVKTYYLRSINLPMHSLFHLPLIYLM